MSPISTQEFRADVKLRVSKLTDRDLAQLLHDSCAYIVVDLSGMIVVASRRVDEIFGYEIGDLIGKPVEALIDTSASLVHSRLRVEFMEPGNTGPTRNMAVGREVFGVKKDGSKIRVAVTITMRVIHQERFAIANLIAIEN